jgi:hypothetical protein
MNRLQFLAAITGTIILGLLADNLIARDGGNAAATVLVNLAISVLQIIAVDYRCKDAGYTSKWATIAYLFIPFIIVRLMFMPTGYRILELRQKAAKAAAKAAPEFDLSAAYRR